MTILGYLASSPTAFILTMGFFGLLVGSFLNVVVYRLPHIMERDWHSQCRELLELPAEPLADPFSLVRPRSRCPQCNHAIRWYENVPILSYIFLRGQCSACLANISIRYPLVEFTAATLAALAAWYFGFGITAILATLLSWSLLTLGLIDYDTRLLPDDITLPFLWLGIAVNIFGVFTPLESAVLGAILGYGVLWSVFQVFRLLTGKEGMGFGDFKLLAMLGAWLGWQQLPLIIILASFAGAIVGISLIIFGGRERSQAIPFGPYLAIAGWIALYWGELLQNIYLNWALTP